jgi:hypothetical protein
LACNWTAEPDFEVPSFGALYLSNRAELNFDSLTKVGVHLQLYNFVNYTTSQFELIWELLIDEKWSFSCGFAVVLVGSFSF